MGNVRTSGCALVLFGSLVVFASGAFGQATPTATATPQACMPVVYAFRHAEDTNPPVPPGAHPPAGTVPIFALTPTGQAHAALYPTMITDFQAANKFCFVAKVYAATDVEKVAPCGNECASATNAFDTARPLAGAVMSASPSATATPITSVPIPTSSATPANNTDNGRLYEYLGNGNNAPKTPIYTTLTATALRKALLATANLGQSSAIFWTSQGLHVLGGVIIDGTSKVPDKNGTPKVTPPRNAVYIFKAVGNAPNIAKFEDIDANLSLYVQCFNFVGATVQVTPSGPRFILPEGSPPNRTQLYYCGNGAETVLGGTLPEGCGVGVECGVITNAQNKNIKGKICNTTGLTRGTDTFGACKFKE